MSIENQLEKTSQIKSDDDCSIYFGEKGYTIYKECLTNEELTYIRTELTVKPYIPKSPIQPPSFPVYRESPLKIYVPRHWGVENYGPPEKVIIPRGEKINVEFNGDLRDYQINIVNAYLKHVGQLEIKGQENAIHYNGGGGLLDVDPGKGKTVMALKIISQLRVKTLVIVHKTFLMNQWKERIQQFLPNARVGTIQGQIVDIDDKDIVLGMLQSLSMKEYPKNMFSSFGLTCYDETHHLGAEVFSKCLLKIPSLYTLGLSGTMERKDGLTFVFKMFIGEIVYREKTISDHAVIVKGIEYKVDDDDFNETKYDYRGNPKFSTMISTICDYSHRSEFILHILKKELEINPDQQFMILGHNKSLLTYLYNAIEHRNISSVGYYIGGMKEAELKKSEDKKVIIATYAMASEGLDIKTLTTLIMASPKTDVCQSVGRILRAKHSSPLVIDIIDSHDIFVNQWQKRKKYYKSQNYKIIMTDNEGYDKDDWEVVYDPLNKKTKKSNNNNNNITNYNKGKGLTTIKEELETIKIPSFALGNKNANNIKNTISNSGNRKSNGNDITSGGGTQKRITGLDANSNGNNRIIYDSVDINASIYSKNGKGHNIGKNKEGSISIINNGHGDGDESDEDDELRSVKKSFGGKCMINIKNLDL